MNDKKIIIDNLLNELNKISLSDPQKALILAQNAFEIASRSNLDEYIAKCLYHIGALNQRIGNFQKSTSFLNKSLTFAQNNNNNELILNIYNCFGNLNAYLESYEDALDYYLKGLNLAQKFDFVILESKFNNNIGEVYRRLGNFEKALYYYKQFYSISDKVSYNEGMSTALTNMAEIFIELNQLKKAKDIVFKSNELAKLTKDKIGNAYNYWLLANIQYKSGDIEYAILTYEKSIAIYEEIGEQYYILESIISYCQLLIELKQYKKALSLLEKSKKFIDNDNLISKKSQIFNFYAQIYEGLEDFEKSIKYYKSYHHIIEINTKGKNQLKFKNILNKYKSLKYEKENEFYRIKNAELESKKNELEKQALELNISYQNIKIINQIIKDISSSLNLDVISDIIYRNIKKLMGIDVFGIGFYNQESEKFKYRFFIANGNKIEVENFNKKNSYEFWTTNNNKPIIIQDINKRSKIYQGLQYSNKYSFEMKSIIYFPLVINQQVSGVITLQSRNINEYSEYKLDILKTFLAYISIALNNTLESEMLANEITQRKMMQQKLETAYKKLFVLSRLDGLTGIFNRHALYSDIQSIFEECKSDTGYLSVIMVDLDYFKKYNDNYGHLAGDTCLKTIINEISSICSNFRSFLCRYGGDEIIILLPNQDQLKAFKIAKEIHRSINSLNIAHEFSPISDHVTVSLGVGTIAVCDDLDYKSIIEIVDNALYSAKGKGRNTIEAISV